MVEVSIIVPVYNLEKYLPRCIDSILKQIFTNFELILVNDGSTDSSGDICEKYAKQDTRILVIHKKNRGVAAARNTGIAHAKGKYIGFVDNDDFVDEQMFEVLYNNAVTFSSNIVVCDFCEVDDSLSNRINNLDSAYKIEHYNNVDALHQLYTRNNITFVVPWNKLYKRCLFNGIRYKVGNRNDDETVAHKLLYYSKKTTYIQTELYYYIQREGSQMDANVFHINKFDALYAFKDREIFFRKIKERDLHQKALLEFMERFFLYYHLATTTLENVDEELKKVKTLFDQSLFYLLKHKEISWKQKVMCLLFSMNPAIFEFVKRKEESKQLEI